MSKKLADTFLQDLENLSDSDDENFKIPEKIENSVGKVDFFGKNIKKSQSILSSASTRIIESVKKDYLENPDYQNFKVNLGEDLENNNRIIPSTLTKEDKM